MSNNIFLYQNGKLDKFGSEKLPESQVKNNIDWVIFGTKEDWVNRQPQYYDFLSKTSPKNTAILKTKNRQVYGKGLEVFDTPFLDTQDKIKLQTFIKLTKDSRVTQRIISDRNKFNGFAVEVIFDQAGEMIMPHHVPFEDVRVSKKVYNKENELEPTQYYYTSDWTLGQAKIKAAPDFTVFEEWDWSAEKYDKSKRYLIYYKGEEYIQEYYPLPDYLGGVPYISADTEVANFVENNVKNGFTGGYLVNFYNGDPTPDQQKEIVEQIDSVLHGTDNAGKSVKSFNENRDSGVEITPLAANGQDDRYINLNNQIRDEIFTSHTINPIVTGMAETGGTLNNNADERRTAVEDFIENYIKPVQDIFDELYNNILSFNELKGMVFLQRLDPIKPSIDTSKLFEVASKSEIRELYRNAGYNLPEADIEEEVAVQALKEINLVFSKEDESICKSFEEFGTLDTEYECIDSREIFAKDVFDAQRQGETFREQFDKTLDSAILGLLNGDSALSSDKLAELTGESVKTINDSIKTLEDTGKLANGVPTEEGQKEIQEVFVVYKYVKRADAPALLKGGKSRPFCLNLLSQSQSKSWSIQDIQAISAAEGYDVFTRRGGWYHNPKTDVNTPYCRHIWEQRLVRRK